MFYQRIAFRCDSPTSVLKRIGDADVPSPREIDSVTQSLVIGLLEKDPAHRSPYEVESRDFDPSK
jgi:hypothetical protein